MAAGAEHASRSVRIADMSESPAWADPLNWSVDPTLVRRRLAKPNAGALAAHALSDLLPQLGKRQQLGCYEFVRSEPWVQLTLTNGDVVVLGKAEILRLLQAKGGFHLEAIEDFSAQAQGRHLVVFVKAYKQQESLTCVYDISVRRWILSSKDPIDGLLHLPRRQLFLAYWEYADYGCSHSGLALYHHGRRIGRAQYLFFRRQYELPTQPPPLLRVVHELRLPDSGLHTSPLNQSLFPGAALCYSPRLRRVYVVREGSIRSVSLRRLITTRPLRRS